DSTYHTRKLINEFTQANPNGSFAYPVPVGGILNQRNSYLNSHRGRVQINYDNRWDENSISAIGGAEISHIVNENNSNAFYGFDNETGRCSEVDFLTSYQRQPTGSRSMIPTNMSFGNSIDRFVSYFANAAYTRPGRYTLSL